MRTRDDAATSRLLAEDHPRCRICPGGAFVQHGWYDREYVPRLFPIGPLKIDQSFVRDITADADDATIVSAVIGMGRNLKQRVIAEGVETHEQLAFLQMQRCDEGQGFQFSHPLSAEDFAHLLADGNDRQSRPRPG